MSTEPALSNSVTKPSPEHVAHEELLKKLTARLGYLIRDIMADDIFKCSVCGTRTDLANDDPNKTFCHDHCPDHEYEYDSIAAAPMCKTCGIVAPHDYYAESDFRDD